MPFLRTGKKQDKAFYKRQCERVEIATVFVATSPRHPEERELREGPVFLNPNPLSSLLFGPNFSLRP